MKAILFLALFLTVQGCYVDKESRYYQAGFEEGKELGIRETGAYVCGKATIKEKQEAWDRGYEVGKRSCK